MKVHKNMWWHWGGGHSYFGDGLAQSVEEITRAGRFAVLNLVEERSLFSYSPAPRQALGPTQSPARWLPGLFRRSQMARAFNMFRVPCVKKICKIFNPYPANVENMVSS